TLGGSGDADHNFDHGGFGINGSIGYFFNPNFELGLRQNVGFNGRTSDEEWLGATRLAADWHFLLGKFVPFIGGNFGIDYNENDNTWGIGPELGFKYFIYEKTFLMLMREYRWNFNNFSDIDNNASHGRFIATVGIGFNVGRRH